MHAGIEKTSSQLHRHSCRGHDDRGRVNKNRLTELIPTEVIYRNDRRYTLHVLLLSVCFPSLSYHSYPKPCVAQDVHCYPKLSTTRQRSKSPHGFIRTDSTASRQSEAKSLAANASGSVTDRPRNSASASNGRSRVGAGGRGHWEKSEGNSVSRRRFVFQQWDTRNPR